VQPNNAILEKHKNRRADPGMLQAILCITRSINGRQICCICGETPTLAGKPRHDASQTMYYSFYKRVQTNVAFVTKHKHRRANSGVIQTQKTGLKTQAFYIPLAGTENCALLATESQNGFIFRLT